jgi:hypothetical protein
MNGKWIGIVVLIVIVVGAAAGYGGYSFGHQAGLTDAQNIRNSFLASRGMGGGGFGGGAGGSGYGGGAGGGGSGSGTGGGYGGATGGGTGGRQFSSANFANGQVKDINGNTIDLTTASSQLQVVISPQTQIEKQSQGSISDIQPGARITVQGTRAADGSMTAQTVQIGGRFGAAAGGQNGAGGSQPQAGGAGSQPQSGGGGQPPAQ